MRKLIVVAAILLAGTSGSVAVAGTVRFQATHGQVDLACATTQGSTYTGGTGKGGFGCKTASGEVKCDSKGNCTGTCGNCGARTTNAAEVLMNRPAAGLPSRGY